MLLKNQDPRFEPLLIALCELFNLSWVKFPAACCDKSELNPKNMILCGLPRRDFIVYLRVPEDGL
jgi:hypothetical protein